MNRSVSVLLITLSMYWAGIAHAQDIAASPGTYELLEGTAMQFNARANPRSGAITRYRWEIVSGAGASLVNADQPRVTFLAPAIPEDKRFFTLQLSLEYDRGNPSRAQINIRVHKKRETTVTRSTSPWVSGAVGFGFGYLWGGWWPYPPLIVIPCPPPDTWWPPEEIPPIAVPLPEDPYYDDWVANNPDEAELYFGEDALSAETLPAEEIEQLDDPEVQPLPEDGADRLDLELQAIPEIEPEAPAGIEPLPEIEPEPMPLDVPMDMDIPMDMGGPDDF